MSTQRWNDEMLDRLASTVESNANLIQSNTRVISALANVAAEARDERQQLFQLIPQQQTEIVGLRTETIRLIDILLHPRDRSILTREGQDSAQNWGELTLPIGELEIAEPQPQAQDDKFLLAEFCD